MYILTNTFIHVYCIPYIHGIHLYFPKVWHLVEILHIPPRRHQVHRFLGRADPRTVCIHLYLPKIWHLVEILHIPPRRHQVHSFLGLADPRTVCIHLYLPKVGIWLKFCIFLHVVTRFIVSGDARILAHSAYIYVYTNCVMPVVCFLHVHISYFVLCLTFYHTLPKR